MAHILWRLPLQSETAKAQLKSKSKQDALSFTQLTMERQRLQVALKQTSSKLLQELTARHIAEAMLAQRTQQLIKVTKAHSSYLADPCTRAHCRGFDYLDDCGRRKIRIRGVGERRGRT